MCKAPSFWRDWPFWLAMALGPMCWVLLQRSGLPLRDSVVSWKLLLMVVVAYPVLEEYVFRGGLQGALYQRDAFARSALGVSIANILTSTAFAAAHLYNHTPLWAALIFFPSLVFGWMRDRYGNIHASVILHMTYNAGFISLFAGPD